MKTNQRLIALTVVLLYLKKIFNLNIIKPKLFRLCLSAKLIFTCVVITLFIYGPVNAQYAIYSSCSIQGLKLVSYSSAWDENKLRELYAELLNNFHGDELKLLSAIYLYPDSPYGVNGYYFEDIAVKDGILECGENSYIELYNMDKTDTVKKAAKTLSHEYGHHYSICNIILKEGKYYTKWAESEYAAIRGLSNYDVFYGQNPDNSSYRWDVSEIIADDYVQLLGSRYAKLSVDYPDVYEMLESSDKPERKYEIAFNLMPQGNPYIPLAADVPGLYEYMLSLGGGVSNHTIKSEKPKILSVEEIVNKAGEKEYTANWNKVSDNSDCEYTLVMYPADNPLVPIPIKTVKGGEITSAKFGSAAAENSDGSLRVFSNRYEGDYELLLYYMDADGFMHRSEPYCYSFGSDYTDYDIGYNSPLNEQKTAVQEAAEQEEPDYEKLFAAFYENFNNEISLTDYYYAVINGIYSFFSQF